jgi:hypothetical protein
MYIYIPTSVKYKEENSNKIKIIESLMSRGEGSAIAYFVANQESVA